MSRYINVLATKPAAQQEKIIDSERHLPTGLSLFGSVAAAFVLLYAIAAMLPHHAGAGQAGQLHGHLVFRGYVPQP